MKFALRKTLATVLALAMLACFACSAFGADIRTVKDIPPLAGDSFSVLLAGDAQIGAGGLERDTEAWTDSLTNALAQWGRPAFLITAGDNINTHGSAEQLEGFIAPLASLDLPVAPTPGNHDDAEVLDNFDLPNRDGGNYWYTYGDALFMHLDSNYNFGTIFNTVRFLLSTVLKNRDADWRFVTLHHSFYTSHESRANNFESYLRRALYGPLFDLLDIDMVFMGHDHVYIRTKPMKLWMPNENGTTYVTLNSSSGSKLYNVADSDFYYTAIQMQPRVPMLSKIDVTPQAVTFTSCRTDTMEVLDSCVITK